MVITTRITVAEDGTLSVATPLPAGEYLGRIEVAEAAGRAFSAPHALAGWLTLRREDLYIGV